MKLTDDRYAAERQQFELALRMIGHEARTRTIRECTGLSDDRIRKLYANYFRYAGVTGVRRHRGKSPRQVGFFVKNARNQLQSTTLVALFLNGLLLKRDATGKLLRCWPRPNIEFGHRFCRSYENYLLLHRNPQLSFEWAWNLLRTISYNDELILASCGFCAGFYVQDAFALDHAICPACEIERHKRRRPGAGGVRVQI